jgi:hypothetical protein
VKNFKALYRNLPGGTEENTENLGQDDRCPGRNLKPGLLEYEAGLLTIRPRRYVRGKKRLLGSIVTQNGNMLLATNF